MNVVEAKIMVASGGAVHQSEVSKGDRFEFGEDCRRYLSVLEKRRINQAMMYLDDLIDRVGGYPFEVAKPGRIFEFYRQRGLELRLLKNSLGKNGCNECVFLEESK